MGKQLEHLEKTAEFTNVIIQILPSCVADHPGAEGPLRVLEFADTPPIGYTEGRSSGRVIESRAEVAAAMTHYDLIRAAALSRSESLKMVASLRSETYG